MSNPQQYKPGDIANGYVLSEQGQWVPIVAQPQMAPAKKKRPVFRRWYAIAGYGVAGIIIATQAGGGGDATTAVDTPSTSAPATASKPQDSTPPAETPSEAPAASQAPAKPKPKPSKPAAPPAPAFDLAVDAGKLIKEYDDNEFAADQVYKGKTLKVTGVVDQIDTDLFDEDEYILDLTDGDEWAFLTVSVHGLSQDDLASVKQGQTVTVIAEFDDGGDLGVDLNNGRLA